MTNIAIYTIIINILAAAGIHISPETAKQLRRDFKMLKSSVFENVLNPFIKELLEIKKFFNEKKVIASDDWLIQHYLLIEKGEGPRVANGYMKDHLLAWANDELWQFLKEETDSGLRMDGKPSEAFIHSVNFWLQHEVVINGDQLKDRMSVLFDLHLKHFDVATDENGNAKQARFVSGEEDHQRFAMLDKYIVDDIIIRGAKCRIWLEKEKLAGMIKASDSSDKKLLSFIWGKKPNGQWYSHPAVYQNGVRLQFRDGLKTYSASELRNKQVVEAVEAAIKRVYSDYHKAA